jgi:hypothetical protein
MSSSVNGPPTTTSRNRLEEESEVVSALRAQLVDYKLQVRLLPEYRNAF